MAAYYFDTSGIVKRYVVEAGTTWVRGIADPSAGNLIYICRVTTVEVAAAVTRRQRGGGMSTADAAAALAEFRRDAALEYRLIELTPALFDSAVQLAEAHGLRAYDAVQLAVAFELHSQRMVGSLPPVTLVSADQELNAAGMALGLQVEDPSTQP